MILRRTITRHSCQAYKQRSQWKRTLATESDLQSTEGDIERIEGSLDNSLKETKSIESQADTAGVKYVPQIDSRTHLTQQLLNDGTRQVYEQQRRQQKRTKHLGTTISPHYQPHKLLTNPPRPSDISLELLLASQSHLGHKTTHWHPGNSQYIFGVRQGIHVISLDVTAAHLRRACRVVRGVTERGGLILFVGTRDGQERCVVNAAKMAGGYHLFERWVSGAITNRNQILGGCKLKAVDPFDREVPDPKKLRDEPAMKPDLVVCLNPLENWVLLHECGLQNVPTIGIIDTDANPTWVTYPIPANDDSLRCVQVIAGVLGRAGQEGQIRRKESALRGEITYLPVDMSSKDDRERSEGEHGRDILKDSDAVKTTSDLLPPDAQSTRQSGARSGARSRRDAEASAEME